MRPDDGLDSLLADAAVPFGGAGAEEIAASRLRIERELAEAAWGQTLHRDTDPRRFLARPQAPLPVSLPEQAAHDLLALCARVIRDSRAVGNMAGLVDSPRIEPDGALTFACLLHLAGNTDGAQFWWQFCAGAGGSTAALFLYLLHLQRGELRDAQHWAAQAAALEEDGPAERDGGPDRGTGAAGGEAGPRPRPRGQEQERQQDWQQDRERSRERDGVRDPLRAFYAWDEPSRPMYRNGFSTVESMLLRTLSGLGAGPADDLWARGRNGELAAAVRRLAVQHDHDFGTVPRPDPGLASRLEVCGDGA
ncbi:hypothetical protein [Streptomyces aidingensis]|uniref:Uncharacterized protein n=1 Tax=Streptomyces aidingensis TaxID=910347 RepID=A0A1I1QCL9_9ACTN|nr:hypothetical protein [Streptomyces aidingensis]SFD19777.1 hypothetical protein SAMN05421773_11124 [Streptomyces aidingensis]